jgi:hypothetical protein
MIETKLGPFFIYTTKGMHMAYSIIITLSNASFLYKNGEFCLFW